MTLTLKHLQTIPFLYAADIYLEPDSSIYGADEINPYDKLWNYRSSSARTLFNEIVSKCGNVNYVISGYQQGSIYRTIKFSDRTVQEILIDFQYAATPHTIKEYNLIDPKNPHFGMGLMAFMFFDKNEGLIKFRAYSPWAQKNGWYDKYADDIDSFSVPLIYR